MSKSTNLPTVLQPMPLYDIVYFDNKPSLQKLTQIDIIVVYF